MMMKMVLGSCYAGKKGNLVEYEDTRQPLAFGQYWDSEGEDELSKSEAAILYQVTKLAMEQDKAMETSDFNGDSPLSTWRVNRRTMIPIIITFQPRFEVVSNAPECPNHLKKSMQK